MKSSNAVPYPPLSRRLFSVWYRHTRVYTKNLISNGLPPFLEPLLFLLGVGLGLGTYITQSMEGLSYIEFLGTGLLVTAAMFTAAYECTFGTFIRLEFEKVYDGMLAAPITVNDLIVGEIIWAGTKGVFFTFAVLCVLTAFRIVHLPAGLLTPLVGFLTGLMFATLSLWVTSFVKTINHFNFYLTGIISPMFFFSGVVFPISNLPPLGAIHRGDRAADALRAPGAGGLHRPLSTEPALEPGVRRRLHGDHRAGWPSGGSDAA